jgi:hypothetical protein
VSRSQARNDCTVYWVGHCQYDHHFVPNLYRKGGTIHMLSDLLFHKHVAAGYFHFFCLFHDSWDKGNIRENLSGRRAKRVQGILQGYGFRGIFTVMWRMFSLYGRSLAYKKFVKEYKRRHYTDESGWEFWKWHFIGRI